jgi:hypothetical protein
MDLERDKTMARMGAFCSYDTFTIEPVWNVGVYAGADEIKADLVKGFVDAGYIDRLILSSDVNLFGLGWTRSSPYTGKTTMADMLRTLRVGIAEETFWRVMTENPKKVLPIQTEKPGTYPGLARFSSYAALRICFGTSPTRACGALPATAVSPGRCSSVSGRSWSVGRVPRLRMIW